VMEAGGMEYKDLQGGAANITGHSFRRSRGVHLLQHGFSTEVVKELYGHEDVKITRRYINIGTPLETVQGTVPIKDGVVALLRQHLENHFSKQSASDEDAARKIRIRQTVAAAKAKWLQEGARILAPEAWEKKYEHLLRQTGHTTADHSKAVELAAAISHADTVNMQRGVPHQCVGFSAAGFRCLKFTAKGEMSGLCATHKGKHQTEKPQETET